MGVQLFGGKAGNGDAQAVLEKGIGQVDDRVVMDIVEEEIGQDIPEEEKEAAAVNDFYVAEDGDEPEEQGRSKEKGRDDEGKPGVQIVHKAVGAVAVGGLPAEDGPEQATEPGAEDHGEADHQDEGEGAEEAAPEIAGLRDGVGEIVFLCVVFEVAIKGGAHDGRAHQQEEDAGGGAELGEYGRGVDHFLFHGGEVALEEGEEAKAEDNGEIDIEGRSAQPVPDLEEEDLGEHSCRFYGRLYQVVIV